MITINNGSLNISNPRYILAYFCFQASSGGRSSVFIEKFPIVGMHFTLNCVMLKGANKQYFLINSVLLLAKNSHKKTKLRFPEVPCPVEIFFFSKILFNFPNHRGPYLKVSISLFTLIRNNSEIQIKNISFKSAKDIPDKYEKFSCSTVSQTYLHIFLRTIFCKVISKYF